MKKYLKKLFCLHFYVKTGFLGSMLIEHTCISCGKKTYRNHFDAPINYIK
jgi:hypothetical protein